VPHCASKPLFGAAFSCPHKTLQIKKKATEVAVFMDGKRLPDKHPVFRRQVHLVARFHLKSLIKARLVFQGAVGADRRGSGL